MAKRVPTPGITTGLGPSGLKSAVALPGFAEVTLLGTEKNREEVRNREEGWPRIEAVSTVCWDVALETELA